MSDLETSIEYYKDLLLYQYINLPKARETIGLLVKQALIDLLPIAMRDAFDIETAVGAQLDILGEYIGFDRTIDIEVVRDYFTFDSPSAHPTLPVGFIDYNTTITQNYYTYSYYEGGTTASDLSDEEYRFLLKLKILTNKSDASLADIQAIIYAIFGTDLILIDNKDMTFAYYVKEPMRYLATIAYRAGLLPKPMGVGIIGLFPVTSLDDIYIFGDAEYTAPAALSFFNNAGMIDYADTTTDNIFNLTLYGPMPFEQFIQGAAPFIDSSGFAMDAAPFYPDGPFSDHRQGVAFTMPDNTTGFDWFGVTFKMVLYRTTELADGNFSARLVEFINDTVGTSVGSSTFNTTQKDVAESVTVNISTTALVSGRRYLLYIYPLGTASGYYFYNDNPFTDPDLTYWMLSYTGTPVQNTNRRTFFQLEITGRVPAIGMNFQNINASVNDPFLVVPAKTLNLSGNVIFKLYEYSGSVPTNLLTTVTINAAKLNYGYTDLVVKFDGITLSPNGDYFIYISSSANLNIVIKDGNNDEVQNLHTYSYIKGWTITENRAIPSRLSYVTDSQTYTEKMFDYEGGI